MGQIFKRSGYNFSDICLYVVMKKGCTKIAQNLCHLVFNCLFLLCPFKYIRNTQEKTIKIALQKEG